MKTSHLALVMNETGFVDNSNIIVYIGFVCLCVLEQVRVCLFYGFSLCA